MKGKSTLLKEVQPFTWQRHYSGTWCEKTSNEAILQISFPCVEERNVHKFGVVLPLIKSIYFLNHFLTSTEELWDYLWMVMKGNKLFATFLCQLFTFFHKSVLAQGMASSGGFLSFLSSLINMDIIVFISLAQTDRNRSLIDYTKHKKNNFLHHFPGNFFLIEC